VVLNVWRNSRTTLLIYYSLLYTYHHQRSSRVPLAYHISPSSRLPSHVLHPASHVRPHPTSCPTSHIISLISHVMHAMPMHKRHCSDYRRTTWISAFHDYHQLVNEMAAGQPSPSVSESVKVTVHALCHCSASGATRRLTNYPLWVPITTATSVRNLGVTMDSSLSFLPHVNHVISSSYYQLRRIRNSIKALPFDTAKTIVNCFVISRTDYCNSLLIGVPQYAVDRLQRVMNAAARMLCEVCGAGKYSHVTGLIRDCLHWLPISQRIRFKLCLTMYKVMHYQAPVYLSKLCERVESRTRASTRGDLTVQRTRTKFGERAFIVAGPATWNWLPSTVSNASSVNCFKKTLKTLLFAIG